MGSIIDESARVSLNQAVRIDGLVSKPELNGSVGCVVGKSGDRLAVRYNHGFEFKQISVKRQNLKDLSGRPGETSSHWFWIDDDQVLEFRYAKNDVYECWMAPLFGGDCNRVDGGGIACWLQQPQNYFIPLAMCLASVVDEGDSHPDDPEKEFVKVKVSGFFSNLPGQDFARGQIVLGFFDYRAYTDEQWAKILTHILKNVGIDKGRIVSLDNNVFPNPEVVRELAGLNCNLTGESLAGRVPPRQMERRMEGKAI
eukprot:gene386-691_t